MTEILVVSIVGQVIGLALLFRARREAADYREALGRAEVYMAELQARCERYRSRCFECGDAPAVFEGRCADCHEMVMAVEEAEQMLYERWLNGEDYD